MKILLKIKNWIYKIKILIKNMQFKKKLQEIKVYLKK